MSPVALRVNKVNVTTALNGVPGEGDGEEREGEEGEEGRREEGGDGDEGEGQREEEDVQVEQAARVRPRAAKSGNGNLLITGHSTTPQTQAPNFDMVVQIPGMEIC